MIQSIDYFAIAPPLVLALVAGLVLLLDAFLKPGPKVTTALGLITLAGVLVAGAFLIAQALRGETLATFCVPGDLAASGPAGRPCSFVVDPFTLIFAGLVLAAAVVVVLLSMTELSGGRIPVGEWYFLLLCTLVGAVTLPASRDLIMLVVALELVSLPVFALTALRRYDGRSSEAAVKLFLVSIVSTAVMLFGVSLLYGMSGTVYLTQLAVALGGGEGQAAMAGGGGAAALGGGGGSAVLGGGAQAIAVSGGQALAAGGSQAIAANGGQVLAASGSQGLAAGGSQAIAVDGAGLLAGVPGVEVSPSVVAVGVVLVVAGFAFKIAAVPFHAWAADVYQGAPIPVAALLSVISKASGFAGLMLVLLVALGGQVGLWAPMVAIIAALTMTVGNLLAMRQRSAVRLLAWSSVAQSGYILAPLAVQRPEAVQAAIAYLVIYAAMNLGAFAVVMMVSRHVERNELDDYRGLAYRSPAAALTLAFSLICLAGLPPGLAGLFAKIVVFREIVQGGLGWLALVMAVNTVIGLYYYVVWTARLFTPAAEAVPGRGARAGAGADPGGTLPGGDRGSAKSESEPGRVGTAGNEGEPGRGGTAGSEGEPGRARASGRLPGEDGAVEVRVAGGLPRDGGTVAVWVAAGLALVVAVLFSVAPQLVLDAVTLGAFR
ncbi:NADH-quinone oxidoreductase subunit N [Nonomuraea soli]|uniref:NADH-quinone oxidoreductase subunit N n=1 Tax=Nonomuraea soli TaxID=1032476 RepID=A0A7W0HVL7_9ACTN|nr:NADH-quinone oxidoreductase subunit N [Nonomuraea soli]MBA2897338.1 NADH-quinone oxidoreductase subunit N [Nonomuraea soli]